jgi:Protein of unknown function (DUF3180)
VRPARITTALLVALVAGVVSWVALNTWTGSGGNPPPLPWASAIGTAALVAVVIAAGLPVRRWVRGRRDRPLDPLVAARTAVLGKAAAYGGAVLTGWYVSQALVVLPDLVGVRRERFWIGVIAAAMAVALSAAGFVVQYWCRIPPSDEDDVDDPRDSDRDSVG